MSDKGGPIKTFQSADGKARLFIIKRKDGRFSFEGERQAYKPTMGNYWMPCDISGLFESAEAAEREARTSIPWLRDQNSN